MKVVQTALSAAVLAIVAALGYYFAASSALDRRVGEQGEKLENVSQESAKQGKSLLEHGTRIETVEKRVGAAEVKIGENTAALESVRSAAEKDREKAARLESDLGALKDEQGRLEKELGDERSERLRIDREIERRLKELEKKAGSPPPTGPTPPPSP